MRVTERHVSGDRLHARPKVGDPLRQPLELPAGLDLLVEMCGTECLQLDDLGLELHPLQDVGIAGYQIYFWGTSGQTIAMRMFHLRVVDANTGAPIGIGRAVVRWLMSLVNSWACYIGWIWVAFDARKQGWHDKVANSVVLLTP